MIHRRQREPSSRSVRRPGWSAPSASLGGSGPGPGRRRRRVRRRWAGGRRHEVGPHPVLAVGHLVGPGLRTDDEVLAERREVVLAVLDDRRQVLHAQLRRLLGAQPGGGLDRAAQERDRVGEVVERAARRSNVACAAGRCCRSSAARVGATCRVCLMSSRLSFSAVDTDASLSAVVPSVSRLSATKVRDIADDGVRGPTTASPTSSGIVGQQPGHRGEVAVELPHQIAAVLQRR